MKLTRQQTTVIGIFALFLGPVILVMLMQSRWWNYQPDGMKNHGQLVRPAIHLPLDTHAHTAVDPPSPGIAGKWLLLYVLSEPCDQVCISDITALRQIHKATGRQQEHLAIGLISRTGPGPDLKARLVSIYSKLNFISDPSATALASLDKINAGLLSRENRQTNFKIYIIDPMQNVIMAFENGTEPGNIHKDLKRLLKWSSQEN